MKKIFVVDDNETNRVTAKTALENYYVIFALPSAEKMFKLLEKITPDLILLDIDMPEMDGFEAMHFLKLNEKSKGIPVIFLTSKSDAAVEIRGFELGVVDFINKPFTPPVLMKRIENHLEQDKLIKKSLIALHSLHNATIGVLANLVESRDKITGKHIERTQGYLKILVDELVTEGIYADEILDWDMSLVLPSAQLHDVGKIVISDVILNKTEKLTDEEYEKIKEHASEGERIINEIIEKTDDDDFLIYARKFAGTHHEKWNGKGYPRGLAGENIPLEGRIMAIADVYDALVSQRPYKKAFSHEEAVRIIKEDSGTHFDPILVEVFLKSEQVFRFTAHKFNQNQI
ncbi:MAG: response regulator [Oscillospiraceae bacterium]|nr:response regulator [Oscillospiraceae bacterium]